MSRRARAWLLALCVAGAALRLYRLDFQSLWHDELASWSQSHEPSISRVITRAREDVHVPAHPLLLFAVQRCCGDSEIWLRLPSVIAGTASIAALYAFVRRLYGPREAWLAAPWIAFGSAPIAWSQTARPYALLVLGACVTGCFWHDALRQLRGRAPLSLRARVGFAASAIATAYTHYFGLLLVALQCLSLLGLGREPARAAGLVAPVALAGLPWLPALLEDAGRTHIWIAEPDLGTLLDTWRVLFREPEGFAWVVGGLCALSLARRFAARWREQGPALLRTLPDSPTGLMLAWLLAPISIAFAISKLRLPIYTTRNLLVVLPAAYALVARSLTDLFPSPRALRIAGVALALTLLVDTLWTGERYTRIRNAQFREAAAVVARHEAETPGALVLIAGGRPDYFDYYLTHLGARSRVDFRLHEDDLAAEIEQIDARHPEWLWLLAAHRPAPDALLTALETRYEPVRYEPLHKAWVRLYTRRHTPLPRIPNPARSRAWRLRATLLRYAAWKVRKSSIASRSSASARWCATASIPFAV